LSFFEEGPDAQQIAVLIAAPSPLVGEGYTGASPAFDTVRGCQPDRTPHPSSLREATFSHKGRREERLPRRHADGAVETDGLAVEHRVLDDVNREVAVLRGIAEARR